jgi:hypothetical protein
MIGTSAHKKSSQKSIRPRGAKDVVTFPGAIGRNDACRRADVGECVAARTPGSVSRRWKASVPTNRFGVDLHKLVDPPRVFVVVVFLALASLPRESPATRRSFVVRGRIGRARNTVKGGFETHEKLF